MGHWVKEILRLFRGIATPTGKRTVWGGLGGRGLGRLCRTRVSAAGLSSQWSGVDRSLVPLLPSTQPYLNLFTLLRPSRRRALPPPSLRPPRSFRLISDATIPGRSGNADLAPPPARAAAAKADAGVSCAAVGALLVLRVRSLLLSPPCLRFLLLPLPSATRAIVCGGLRPGVARLPAGASCCKPRRRGGVRCPSCATAACSTSLFTSI